MDDSDSTNVSAKPVKKVHRHYAYLSVLGERIGSLRKKKGLSLEGLAYACDMSKGNLSDIEKGKRDPRYCTLRTLAHTLEITVSDLLKGL